MTNEIMMREEVRMNSVELVDMINQFRGIEGNRSELLHKNLMSKISKEIETLDSLGFRGQLNFKPSSYVNSQNKEQPCYELNRDGVLQLCMSESTIVRYKVLEYVNQLESEIKRTQSKANLLLSIYNGGQEGVLASKQLTEMEVEEATRPLLETIGEQKPKVEFADRLLKTKDNILIREYAKVLCDEGFIIGEKKLYRWLRDNKFLMKNNEPYQKYVDRGIFFVKVSTVSTAFGDKQVRTTLITPSGQLYVFDRIKMEG